MPGCELLAFAITGLPAASAAAKSPPATLLKANGKLFGPKTQTGPMGASTERMLSLVSIVGSAHEPSRAAAAAWRSCPVVRGSSTSASRGAFGRPVSACAMSTMLGLARLDPAGVGVEEGGDPVGRRCAQHGRGGRRRRERRVAVGPVADRVLARQLLPERRVLGAERAAGLRLAPLAGDEDGMHGHLRIIISKRGGPRAFPSESR